MASDSHDALLGPSTPSLAAAVLAFETRLDKLKLGDPDAIGPTLAPVLGELAAAAKEALR